MKRLVGLLLMAGALVFAADQVPFVAVFTSSVPGGALPDCGSNSVLAPLASVGTGHATHLGLFTAWERICLDQASLQFSQGVFRLTGANGDSVVGTHYGRLVPTSAITAAIYGVFVIIGGTGRFANATGGGYATGTLDFITNEANDFVMRGTISRPNQ